MHYKLLWKWSIVVVLCAGIIILWRCHTPSPVATSPPSGHLQDGHPVTGTSGGEAKSLFFPATTPLDTIISHPGFHLQYSERHEQAKWVAYTLTSAMAQGTFDRTDNFREDPKVHTGSASLDDYRGSGYDRGHLAPAGDMAWSEDAMSSSFYFSNISPQQPSFNRGIWKKLEYQVRQWAIAFDSIHIVTGPCFKDSLGIIGPNQVCIPKNFYKAVLIHHKDHWRSVGFWMANEGASTSLTQFLIAIDSLEGRLHLNLWANLPDSTERTIEAHVDTSFWHGLLRQ